MAFVYEKVKEEDKELWLSMGFKNFIGDKPCDFTSGTYWCADRKKNAYLNCIGKGGPETPIIFELWWNGNIIRFWALNSLKNIDNEIFWEIQKIYIPEKISNLESEIIDLIKESVLSDSGYYSLFVSKKQIIVKCKFTYVKEF